MRPRRRLGDRGGLGWRNYEKIVNDLGRNWWKSAERYLVMSRDTLKSGNTVCNFISLSRFSGQNITAVHLI
jgi:hypothetical protein